ncbi:MAG: macro domain-containing protein [Ktedonobacteraceae bacterium]|nr:macro domain-containing protein [Ktedonobacteraceae bacterium]
MSKYIVYQQGSIFEANAQVIVNPVNCQSVMSKGLAAEFKQRYPAMFPIYQRDCKDRRLRVGRPTLYQDSTPWVLNFPTKDDWRKPSTLEIIEAGLQYLLAHYQQVPMTSIAFPKLGTGEGGLSWDEVGSLMVQYLTQMEIPTTIYIEAEDVRYQLAGEVPSLQVGATFKEIDPLFTVLQGLPAQICLVRDDRYNPVVYYYICVNRVVQVVLAQEEWAVMLYKNIKASFS